MIEIVKIVRYWKNSKHLDKKSNNMEKQNKDLQNIKLERNSL
jgi:hypothetical protein